MRSYTDIHGQTHQVQITLGVRRRLKEQTGVDLLQAATDPKLLNKLMTDIATDPDYLVRLLAICESTTTQALEVCFDATTFDIAATCVVEAIIDFFPESSPVRRPLLDLMAKAKTYREKTSTEIETQLQEKAASLDWDTVGKLLDESMSGCGE